MHFGTFWIILHAFWNILEFSACFLEHSEYILSAVRMYRVSQKNVPKFWRAVAPLNFELGIKVGCVLELSGSQL